MVTSNIFNHLNKIFAIFGFESIYYRKLLNTVMSVIMYILILTMCIFSFAFGIGNLLCMSWSIKNLITSFAFLLYKRRHKKLYNILNNYQILDSHDSKNTNRLSLLMILICFVYCIAFIMTYSIIGANNEPL